MARRVPAAPAAPWSSPSPGGAVGRQRLRWRFHVGRLGAPHFVDESATAGIDHRYTGEFEFFVGGGVAAFDCNDDGRDELYFAGGSSPAALYLNESPIGGALRFSPLASPATDLTDVTGAYPLDIDSEGHTDLVVLRRGGNAVLRGLGDCRFEDATDELGIERGAAWTVGFSATWGGRQRAPHAGVRQLPGFRRPRRRLSRQRTRAPGSER